MLTSLYDIDTPGNLVELTIETPSGFGGKDAAEAASIKGHTAEIARIVNTIVVQSQGKK